MSTTATVTPVAKKPSIAHAKATKKAKEQKPKAERAAQGPRVLEGDDRKITVLLDENPKRKAGASYQRFAKYRTGMTITQALQAGVLRADIAWDLAHDYIKLGK